MRNGGPEVRRPLRRGHLRGEPFELAATDVLQVLPERVIRRFLVEEHRQVESCRRFGTHVLRQRDALLHRHPFDRHEWYDVDSAESRMFTAMRTEIDEGKRLLEEREGRSLDAGGVADEREDGAVVRRIRRVVE